MGVWCGFARNRSIEKTDAVLVLNIEAAQMNGREQPDQMLHGKLFALDFDRLMDDRSREGLTAAQGRDRVQTHFWATWERPALG